MKRKMEITFETEELISIKRFHFLSAFCQKCNANVQMLTTETAAKISGLSEREIFRLIEKAEIHFIEAERILICPNSLPAIKGVIKK